MACILGKRKTSRLRRPPFSRGYRLSTEFRAEASIPRESERVLLTEDRKSDKPFSTFLTETDSGREPGIAVVFDRSLAFDRDGTDEPIIIAEFKRPGRTSYGRAENLVTQALEYVNIMRNGSAFKDRTGRIRKPIPISTHFICFVIAGFTPKLIEIVSMSIAQNKSADGEGYFGFSLIHNAVFEVFPYNKLLHDARLRNEAFFSKLGLS